MSGGVKHLVGVKWLAERLLTQTSTGGAAGLRLRVVEATRVPPNPGTTIFPVPETYRKAHLPTATYMNVLEASDLSSPFTATRPSAEQFAEYVSSRGISNDDQIVLYDCSAHLAFDSPCTRIWWLFRLFGHDKVSILNGGMRRWVEAGHPVTDEVQPVQPSDFKAKLDESVLVRLDQVLERERDFQMVDVRQRKAFDQETYPGAINFPTSRLYNPNGSFKNENQLKEDFQNAGLKDSERLVAACNTGNTSTQFLFAASLAGFSQAANFDGSWEEYSAFKKAGNS